MIFILPGENDPIYQSWVMLLNGYGYNWYRKENQLRADDLLVREHACHFIVAAADKLQEQESAYARKYLPPATRSNPFPPEDRLATHALIREKRQSLLALEGRIRGLSTPATDRIWQRHRTEVGVLAVLTRKDVQLVGLSQALDTEATKLTPDDWSHMERLAPLFENIQKIVQVISERLDYLVSLSTPS